MQKVLTLFKYIHHDLERLIAQARLPDLTYGQAEVLHAVGERVHKSGARVSQSDLEAFFHVRRSSMSAALKTLEERGYIDRTSDPADSRRKLIGLTPKTYAAQQKFHRLAEEAESMLTSGLNEGEERELKRLLTVVARTLGDGLEKKKLEQEQVCLKN